MSTNIPVSTKFPDNVKARKAEDFKTVYVNWAQSSMTPFDISLVLGESYSPIDEKDGMEVTQKLRVVLNPLEAKFIVGILWRTIKTYEQQFGAINLPESLAEESDPGNINVNISEAMEK